MAKKYVSLLLIALVSSVIQLSRGETTLDTSRINVMSTNRSCQPVTYLHNDCGIISVPANDASHYENNLDCQWIIEVNDSHRISFNFSRFHLEEYPPYCPWDYVTITDLAVNSTLHPFRLCGTLVPTEILSWSNRVLLKFHTDVSVTSTGFSITYAAFPCTEGSPYYPCSTTSDTPTSTISTTMIPIPTSSTTTTTTTTTPITTSSTTPTTRTTLITTSSTTTTTTTTTPITTSSTTPTTTTTPITTSSTTTTTTRTATTSSDSTTATPTTTTTTTRPPPSRLNCSERVPFPSLYPGYSWEAALPGTNVSKPCPSGSNVKNNSATWSCGSDGKWVGLPDMSKCTTQDWSDFENELNNPNSSTTAGDTLEKLASNFTSSIAPGDIISVVHVMDVAKERHKKDLLNVTGTEEAQNITSKYTDSVTKISSKLLEEPAVWDGLSTQSRFESGSQLQENVKEAAVEIAILLDETRRTYNSTVISVMAEQFSSAHYNAEGNRIFLHNEYQSNLIQLPANFYADLPDEKKVAVTFSAYKTLHCVMSGGAVCNNTENTDGSEDARDTEFTVKDLVNSPIIGLTVGNSSWSAPAGSEVEIHFTHIFSRNIYNLTEGNCVWWDSKKYSWSTEGCRKKEETRSGTICSCNHLTNLAVIMDVNGKLSKGTLKIARVITIVGSAISLPSLLLTILTLGRYLWKHKTKNRLRYNIQIHINLCCCLFVSEIVLLAGMDQTQTVGGCGFVAGFLLYLLLATFSWMGVESINVYSLLINVFSNSKTPMKLYYAFAYGCPAIIVAISAGVMKGKGFGTDKHCWLDNKRGLTWAFEGPALTILLMNLIVFVLSIKAIRDLINREVEMGRRGGRDEAKARKWESVDKKRMVLVSFVIATTLGLSWILGFAFMFEEVKGLAIFFVIINSLQGFFLFIALIILDQNRRREMLILLHIHPKTEGSRWFKICYPHGKRNDSMFTSNSLASPSSTSAYHPGDSSNRWAERVSTVSALSTTPRQEAPQFPIGTEIETRSIYENDPKRI